MCVRLYLSQYVPEEQQVQYVQQPQQQVDTSYTNGLKSHTLIAEGPTTTVRA